MTSSGRFLLITRRRRSVPASGARVTPVRRTRFSCARISGVRVSARSDGSDTATCLPSSRSMRLVISQVREA